jgi:hypothetical protein
MLLRFCFFVITVLGLDPRINPVIPLSPLSLVIPAKAGIQLHLQTAQLDPDFRRGDESWLPLKPIATLQSFHLAERKP